MRQACILIVDDDSDNRELLEVILHAQGFATMTAVDGADALAAVARRRPELILLDVMMPGMTGYQVTAEIKGAIATRDIPIIILTALNDRYARTLALSGGAEAFLTKPVNRAELFARVKELLLLHPPSLAA